MRIPRLFTAGLTSPYDGLRFVTRRSELKDPTGRVLFAQEGVQVPESWSQTAVDILAQKYFRRNGVPGKGREDDARQVFHRLAGCWTDWGRRYGYFSSEDDAQAFYDEACYMLARQMAAPNSPQWFNTGLHFAYGIEGPPQGHWFVDMQTGKLTASTSAFARPQPSACFIQSIRDDLVNAGGIFDLWMREARLFKYGSGSGTNFSDLRAVGESLGGGGRSSGLMSFLSVGDRAAGVVRSGGTTRRAAKMVCVDVDHPEIEDFILWKVREERKVAAMVAGAAVIAPLLREIAAAAAAGVEARLADALARARAARVPEAMLAKARTLGAKDPRAAGIPLYDTEWEGEAYLTVSGQNANNSVRLPDEFFAALAAKRSWALRNRTDGSVAREVPAERLWDQMAFAAWDCADPGLQFDTTMNDWHTCPAGGRIRATNPCSEYCFVDDTACNLASLNLVKFVDEKTGALRVDEFRHACRVWTVVLEISVAMAQYPSAPVAEKSHRFRTVGLGYANLGAALMSLALPYDSAKGRAFAGGVTALMTGEAYATSAELAAEKGPFAEFSANREAMLRVVRNHRRAAAGAPAAEYEALSTVPAGLDAVHCPAPLLDAARKSWDRALALGEKHGYRNAQVSVLAPTGTIGLLMDCDTMGIEPDFALVKRKQLAGGGAMRLVNRSVPRALARLGYAARDAEVIALYCEAQGTVEGAPGLKAEHYAVFDCANRCLPRGTRHLAFSAHLDMMAAAQPFLSGGISKTVNMPAESTLDDVKEVFLGAWRRGLKAIALYRDGSKLSQPLATVGDEIPVDARSCGPDSDCT